jgi:hypothetical protein
METPIMLAVIVTTARWIVRLFGVSSNIGSRLSVGFLAVGFLLVAEFVVAMKLRGLSPSEYWAARDPVPGTAYYLALVLMAIMPLLVSVSS